MVMLDQNRVDIVFEITEGPKSKVRQINIIGAHKFSVTQLRTEMVTKQQRSFRIFSSGTSYDPDRLAFDQQKLRQFYLTQGYADFRVVSAVAELTPDKKDFIVTYVVEEGKRYKFGDVKVESQLRDFNGDQLAKRLSIKKGAWYNAKAVEDTVDALTETVGSFGYAFADVRPDFQRNKDKETMSVTFRIAEAPRVYVERIDVNGNTLTEDKVVRREFRLAEGDAFNAKTAALVKQYDGYEPLPGLHVIGKNSLGENIADNAGIAIALKAYHISLNGKPAPVINGLTGDQRFYLSLGQIWRTKQRDSALRTQTLSDEHSPAEFRVIGPTRNQDEWYAAFGVQPGDKYYLKPEERVHLW